MRISIITRKPRSYSVQRLKEAATERGHKIALRRTDAFSVLVEEGKPQLHYEGKPEKARADAVIPRIAPTLTRVGTSVVRQFEEMGIFTLNPSHAISVSRDKLRAFQALSRHRVGMPPTVYVARPEYILSAIDDLGGAPVIIKLLEGTQGVGVILAETRKMAQAVVETLHSVEKDVLIQKFVAESRGRDIRAFVVGGKVVAAMRRQAVGDEFRSNVHRGGSTEAVTLDPAYEAVAVRAAQVMGLRVAGVDLLEGNDGPQLMEVNSSPGLEGIEGATGVDIAGAIIEHIEEQVLFPDVPLEPRLSLGKGFSVAEFHISRNSPLKNKTIGESLLADWEVRVLSIQRDSVLLPNPRSDEKLRVGDVLLAYGKQIALRELIPQDTKGRRTRQRPPSKKPAKPSAKEPS